MRDVERLREKTEISLDDRQIAGLALSLLLLLGGVFALGLLLGKHLAAQEPPVPAAPEMAVVDRKPAPPTPPPAKIDPPEPRPPAAVITAPKPAPAAVVPGPRPAVTIPPPPKPATVAAATAPTVVVLTPPPRDLGEYTVQVGASQDRGEAQRLEQKLRAAGLKPYVIEADLREKGVWYRIRVGAFKDKDTAGRFRRDVERELRSAAVVMSTH
jgi:cell division septation protein DedD